MLDHVSSCTIVGCTRQHLARGLCRRHYDEQRRPPRRLPIFAGPFDRFCAYIEITETCWLWTGSRTATGYGTFTLRTGVARSAHRYAYEVMVGSIPEGLELDHLCRVRHCVNPDHLEPVTHAENMRRAVSPRGLDNWNGAKTHCPNGHPYNGANLYEYRGRRYCKACRREQVRTSRTRMRDSRVTMV